MRRKRREAVSNRFWKRRFKRGKKFVTQWFVRDVRTNRTKFSPAPQATFYRDKRGTWVRRSTRKRIPRATAIRMDLQPRLDYPPGPPPGWRAAMTRIQLRLRASTGTAWKLSTTELNRTWRAMGIFTAPTRERVSWLALSNALIAILGDRKINTSMTRGSQRTKFLRASMISAVAVDEEGHRQGDEIGYPLANTTTWENTVAGAAENARLFHVHYRKSQIAEMGVYVL